MINTVLLSRTGVPKPWYWSMARNLAAHNVHGILQARILDWLPFPSPGNLPNPGIETGSPVLQANYFTD